MENFQDWLDENGVKADNLELKEIPGRNRFLYPGAIKNRIVNLD